MVARDRQSMLVGELATDRGITAKTIRFYEDIGLLPPPQRTAAGYRRYGPDDVRRLEFIRDLQDLGLHLDEITELVALRDTGRPPCADVHAAASACAHDLERRIVRLRRTAEELKRLLTREGASPTR